MQLEEPAYLWGHWYLTADGKRLRPWVKLLLSSREKEELRNQATEKKMTRKELIALQGWKDFPKDSEDVKWALTDLSWVDNWETESPDLSCSWETLKETILSSPDTSKSQKKVWCSEWRFLSHGEDGEGSMYKEHHNRILYQGLQLCGLDCRTVWFKKAD